MLDCRERRVPQCLIQSILLRYHAQDDERGVRVEVLEVGGNVDPSEGQVVEEFLCVVFDQGFCWDGLAAIA